MLISEDNLQSLDRLNPLGGQTFFVFRGNGDHVKRLEIHD